MYRKENFQKWLHILSATFVMQNAHIVHDSGFFSSLAVLFSIVTRKIHQFGLIFSHPAVVSDHYRRSYANVFCRCEAI